MTPIIKPLFRPSCFINSEAGIVVSVVANINRDRGSVARDLSQETHKFESRYLDSLIGPYPEEKAIYVERSPIHAVDQLS
ncbi:MAG: hypothetical protein F6K09_31630, partial [Merismopedia sp. SIO2A8]|nr:hypothetical protein [Merismopedia sp. SIO2A8]